MKTHVEEPVETPNDKHFGTKSTHPAFACIQANRMSGQTVLFGSDYDV